MLAFSPCGCSRRQQFRLAGEREPAFQKHSRVEVCQSALPKINPHRALMSLDSGAPASSFQLLALYAPVFPEARSGANSSCQKLLRQREVLAGVNRSCGVVTAKKATNRRRKYKPPVRDSTVQQWSFEVRVRIQGRGVMQGLCCSVIL